MLPECVQTLELLDQALDGELQEPVLGQVRQHLIDCRKCRAEADLANLLKLRARECMEREPAPAQLVQQVRQRLQTTRIEWVAGVVVSQTIHIEIREQ